MSDSLNKVMLIGNLGFDADLKQLSSGNSVLKFKLACSEKYNNKQGELVEKTEWIQCVLWGKRSDGLSKYMTKGKKVYVEGKFTSRTWEKDDGSKGYATEINVFEVILLGDRSGGGARSAPKSGWAEPEKPASGGEDFGEDEIPF